MWAKSNGKLIFSCKMTELLDIDGYLIGLCWTETDTGLSVHFTQWHESIHLGIRI